MLGKKNFLRTVNNREVNEDKILKPNKMSIFKSFENDK